MRYPPAPLDYPALIAEWRRLAQDHAGEERARLLRLAEQLSHAPPWQPVPKKPYRLAGKPVASIG